MPVQAIPMALIASVTPLGLAMLLLLASATRPRAKTGVFLAGAAVSTLATGFALVFALHGARFGLRSGQTSRYGLRLALGLLLLIAAIAMARRPSRPRRSPARWSRWTTEGGLLAAFLLGIALYLPSPAYLSALERVGSSKLGTVALAGWVVLVGVLVMATIEVPIAAFLLAPGWTIPKLTAIDGWLARHKRTLLLLALTALGVWETWNGLAGLLS